MAAAAERASARASEQNARAHLVEDGAGDGQRRDRVRDVHDARDAALAGAAGQKQVDLWRRTRGSGARARQKFRCGQTCDTAPLAARTAPTQPPTLPRARLLLGVAEFMEIVNCVQHRALVGDADVQEVLLARLVHAARGGREGAGGGPRRQGKVGGGAGGCGA